MGFTHTHTRIHSNTGKEGEKWLYIELNRNIHKHETIHTQTHLIENEIGLGSTLLSARKSDRVK